MKMHTVTGHGFPLMEPMPEDINIDTIALALSRIPRFGGHTKPGKEWSVAAHSLLVTAFLQMDAAPPATQLVGLLHDAHEAYIGDLVGPVYRAMALNFETSTFDQMKNRIDAAIAHFVGLHTMEFETYGKAKDAVAKADLEALAYERQWFLNEPQGSFWEHVVQLPPRKLHAKLPFPPVGEACAAALRKEFDLLMDAVHIKKGAAPE